LCEVEADAGRTGAYPIRSQRKKDKMKLINIEPKDDYILRIFLDDDSVVDFDVYVSWEWL
jgi:hypothetical protein